MVGKLEVLYTEILLNINEKPIIDAKCKKVKIVLAAYNKWRLEKG